MSSSLGTFSPLPVSPVFLTVAQEDHFGADVVFIPPNFRPIFIQLKRSEVMTWQSAKEYKKWHFAPSQSPVYRMHLHKGSKKKIPFKQHRALQILEQQFGPYVFYATSQIPNKSSLDKHYINGTVFSEATAFFSPSQIQLPNLQGSHHVSFTKDIAHMRVYSDEGIEIERKYPNSMQIVERLHVESQDRTRDKQVSDLKFAEKLLLEDIPTKMDFRLSRRLRNFLSRHDDLTQRVAI